MAKPYAEGPCTSYNGKTAPSSSDLKAPVKDYPGADKMPKGPSGGKTLDGPGADCYKK